MKIIIPAMLIFSLASACSSNKKTTQSEVPATENNNPATKTVSGTVTEIQNGKDGYTARIETAEKEIYFVTISRANLSDAAQYRSVALGDLLKVSGESWKMEQENHLTVRRIL